MNGKQIQPTKSGLGAQLAECCLVGTGPWAGAPAPYKPGVVVHTDNSSILRQQRQEDHSHLYRKFKVRLEYVRPSLKKCENLLVSIKVMLQEINYRCKCLCLKKTLHL